MTQLAFAPSTWMTPDIQAYRDQVRRFVAADVTPHEKRWAAQQHIRWTHASAYCGGANEVRKGLLARSL